MKKIISTRYTNLDETESFKNLLNINSALIDLKKLLTPQRITDYIIKNDPLSFSFAASLVNEEVIKNLQQLADEQKVIEKYNKVLAGKIMNIGEKRQVLHHKTRTNGNRGMYGEEQKKIADFAKKVHGSEIKGTTGKKITDVVQIGIGGSDLGPRALYQALERYVTDKKGELPLKAHFISNVDPDDANYVLKDLDVKQTLFIVVSKSGTTQETLTNLKFVQEKAKEKGLKEADISKHFIAVTGKGSPMDNPKKYLASFYIDDNIGGRYSVTSAVGGTVLSLALGADIFEEMLQGAAKIDEASLNSNINKNMPLMDALIGIWERNILNIPVKAIIPYSKALQRFPAHLQQLDCESNGKSVNIYSEKLNYKTGSIIFGEPGTDGQHSFFQKIHQGTDLVPMEFIGFENPQIKNDLNCFDSTSQEKLNANLVAQIVSLALGKDDKNANEAFSGNRPSSLIFAKKLTPEVLGALLAHFENKVMFQGFLWNLNSFDQPGVQLGKKLAGLVLDTKGCKDAVLNSYLKLFNSR